jgi:putative ABC transport system substrate-binding protein
MGRLKIIGVALILAMLLSGCNLQPDSGTSEPRRVGVLVGTDFRLAKLEGLLDSLPAYGYTPGNNIELIVKNAKGCNQDLLSLAKELVAEGVEVILTTGRVETEAAKKAVQVDNPPILFMGLTGIQEEGLVKDLLRPREGLTGIHNDHAALSGKRLELLVKLVPQIKRVLVLYDPNVVPTIEALAAVREAAVKLEVTIEEVPVSDAADIAWALQEQGPRADGILLLPSVFLESEGAHTLVPLALEQGLPVMGVEHGEEEKGFFAVFGITPYDQGFQAARILAKILAGQTPGDIPVEPPAVLKLTVNLDVAEQLGLALDPSMLGYADVLYREGGEGLEP